MILSGLEKSEKSDQDPVAADHRAVAPLVHRLRMGAGCTKEVLSLGVVALALCV